jgi:hypothetical protein
MDTKKETEASMILSTKKYWPILMESINFSVLTVIGSNETKNERLFVMRENFERAAAFVLKQEVEPGHEQDGSLHTDLSDPGGTTRFGISQRAYPNVDLATLDRDGAMKIYAEIWEQAGCNSLAWPLDLIVFDTAFNMGPTRARQILTLTDDPNTYLLNRQLVYYFMSKKKLKIYFRNWIKRTLDTWMEINDIT